LNLTCCIELARTGEPTALNRLVEALRPRVSRMAVYYARRCGEDPDDMVQEAWTGLLEALPELDVTIGSPEHYLVQHARWRVLDAIKRARLRRCMALEDAPDEAVMYRHESGLAAAWVSEFVSQLSKPQRRVLACLLKGLTWREAGSALGCTSANIAYWVRRIRRDYQEWVEE
jgi:RNA polymerase sigma factor (sigma-70 family)